MARYENCVNCNKKRSLSKKYNGGYLCSTCYRNLYQKKENCIKCSRLNFVNKKTINGPICSSCYGKHYQKKYYCTKCNKLSKIAVNKNNKKLCYSCRDKEYCRTPELCISCNQLKRVSHRTKDKNPMCRNCYRKVSGKKYSPRKKDFCSRCKKNNFIAVRDKVSNDCICNNCYTTCKLKEDRQFYLRRRLRSRVNDAFRKYTKTGKIMKAKEYGINYAEIIKFLGPKPDSKQIWEIDHIVPLSSFNLNDPEQVKLAFAPENHQWLTKEENLIKGAKIIL